MRICEAISHRLSPQRTAGALIAVIFNETNSAVRSSLRDGEKEHEHSTNILVRSNSHSAQCTSSVTVERTEGKKEERATSLRGTLGFSKRPESTKNWNGRCSERAIGMFAE